MTPSKLRDLASWFDTYDRMAEQYLLITSADHQDVEELLSIVRGNAVQSELRRWADEIEAAA